MKRLLTVSFFLFPILLLGLVAYLMPQFREWRAAQYIEELESTPLRSVISKTNNGVSSSRVTYCLGSYGVTDVGNLRLVFEDLKFSGESESSLSLATQSASSRGGGSTGVGNRRFESSGIPHGTRCKFGGVTFDLVDGNLLLDSKRIDATGDPTMVLIDAGGEIVDVRPMGYQISPAVGGK